MRRERSRPSRRLLPVLLALALLSGWVASGIPDRRDAAGAASLPYSIVVTPSEGLVDGQAIDVVVQAAPGQRVGVSGKLNVCRADATYTSNDDILPFVGGKCPDKPVSSSASGPWPIRPYPDGSAAVSTVRVGTGRVEWGPAEQPDRFELTCDPQNPCRLVLEIPIEGGQRYIDSSVLLTFADDNVIGACGGVEGDAVNSSGPDRMLGAWVAWTRDRCRSAGTLAPTQAVLTGEGEGHAGFHRGTSDITYSAVGPGFVPAGPDEPRRSSVSVPVAVNAAVVGVLGGYGSTASNWPSGVPHPYEQVAVTMDEMATLFGKGAFTFEIEHLTPVQQRNAELARGFSLSNSSNPNPLAPAGSDAVSFVASSAFDSLAPGSWWTSSLNIAGNPPNVERGVHESLALADPPFSQALFELYSAQAQLKKVVAANEFKPFNYGPIWVLTDLATARQLGIPTVAIQNANGEFVQPTEQSLLRAVEGMDVDADGTHQPDVTTTLSGAYPLTFVEHAVVPTEQLLDESCQPRSGAQANLTGWLEYLVDRGQGSLAPGFVRLTPALEAAARTGIGQVGTATPTGDCAPAQPPAGPGDPGDQPGGLPGDLPGGLPGDLGGLPSSSFGPSGSFGFGGSSGTNSTGGGAASTAAAAAAAGGAEGSEGGGEDGEETAAELIADVEQPGLSDNEVIGWLSGALTIVALAGLAGVAGWVSSGREVGSPRRAGR